jgi:hypothetical protein
LNVLSDGITTSTIAVVGNDVYIVGSYYEGTSPHGVMYPVYWKNGVRVELSKVLAEKKHLR